MPVYIFDCGNCGKREEYLVKPDQIPYCAGCGGQDLTRVFEGQTVRAHTQSKTSQTRTFVPTGPFSLSVEPCAFHPGHSHPTISFPIKEIFPTRDN